MHMWYVEFVPIMVHTNFWQSKSLWKLGQTWRSRSQDIEWWYEIKEHDTMNQQKKYLNHILYHSLIIGKVKVFEKHNKMKIKIQGQGNKA